MKHHKAMLTDLSMYLKVLTFSSSLHNPVPWMVELTPSCFQGSTFRGMTVAHVDVLHPSPVLADTFRNHGLHHALGALVAQPTVSLLKEETQSPFRSRSSSLGLRRGEV